MTPRPVFQRRVCAWCGRGMGSVPCAPALAGQTSHGICEQCEARQQARDVTCDSFAPAGAGSCAVSSATAGRDRHNSHAEAEVERQAAKRCSAEGDASGADTVRGHGSPAASGSRHSFDASPASPSDATRGTPAEPWTEPAPVGQPQSAAAASTPSAAGAGVEFISVLRLAAIIGVSSYLLDTKLRPAHWGAPREIRYSGREMLYAVAVLPELERELAAGGLYELAVRLRRWLDEQSKPGATGWWQKGQYA